MSPTTYSVHPTQRLYLLPTSGTLGSGLEYRFDLTENVRWRFAYSSLDYTQTAVRRSVNYDLNLKMFSRSVILDWHIFHGSFRTSAGVIFGGPSLTGKAFSLDTLSVGGQSMTGDDVQQAVAGINPSQVITSGDLTISGADVIQYANKINPLDSVTADTMTISEQDFGYATGVARYPDSAPYLGIGWGNIHTQKGKFLYSIDLGVMFLAKPKVELSLYGPLADLTDQYYSAETRAYVVEEQQKIEDSLSKYKYFPVFSISLLYRF